MTHPTHLPTDQARPRNATWRPLRRGAQAVAAVGVVAAIAAGCGSSSSSATPAAPATSATPVSASATPAPTVSSSVPAATAANTVTATLTEFKISLSRSTFAPGTYTFDAVNSGHTVHALAFTGPGSPSPISTKDLKPGQSADLTVTLQAGTYDVYCPVGDHKALGMNLSLTVAGAGAATASPAPTTATPATAAPATAAPATAAPTTTAPASSTSGVGY